MRKRIWLPLLAVVVALAAGALFAARRLARAERAAADSPPTARGCEVASGTPLRRVTRGSRATRTCSTNPWLLATVRARDRRRDADSRRRVSGSSRGTTPLTLARRSSSRARCILHQITDRRRLALQPSCSRRVRAHPAIRGDGRWTARRSWPRSVHQAYIPKGSFFPKRIASRKGTTDVELLRTAHEALAHAPRKRVGRSQLRSRGYETDYEALILASIIEKETALAGRAATHRGRVQRAAAAQHAAANGSHRHLRPRRRVRRQSAPPGSRPRYAVQHLHARRTAADADRAARRGVARGSRHARGDRRGVLRRHRPRRRQPLLLRDPRRARAGRARLSPAAAQRRSR